MPIYEYSCPKCGKCFEAFKRSISDDLDAVCPVCQTPAKRLISPAGFILKGSGWYATNYKNHSPSSKP